ncbi:MAG: VOC family protein [candidate division KSB1 bacterium]|nr:VOC family protein [candidate division KSB1 bacterium]
MYATKLGHIHLKVRDLNRAVDFYTRIFNLKVTEMVGDHYAFLSGGSLHHEIALQNVGAGAPTPPPHGVGLYHVAFEVPDKKSFAQAYEHLRQAGIEPHAVNHFISWALYFTDPDGNGLEIYVDTRNDPEGRAQWQGYSEPLTHEKIMMELPPK